MKHGSRSTSDSTQSSDRVLPSVNDPVIISAVQTSVAQSRASSLHNLPIIDSEKVNVDHPFRRWLTTLHKRNKNRMKAVRPRRQRWSLNEFDGEPLSPCSSRLCPDRLRHRKSESWTSGSTALIGATRTAFASMSILTDHYHGGSDRPSLQVPRSRRSERASTSMDLDTDAVRERAMQRRQTIDEIMRTEKEYILSLKALNDLYKSVQVTTEEPLKSDMNQMQGILEKLTDLHHEIENDLQKIRGKGRGSADPTEAADIADVFGKHMPRFFLYEEYSSKYEDMLYNVAIASQNIPNWENYQRGFEQLNNSVFPPEADGPSRKKCLTFGDLHIKPVQRVCKYPLLFAELCKHTPVIDGPNEHLQLEKTLFRLRDTVMEINQASVDTRAREKMQQSWKLQDMLVTPDPLSAPQFLRTLGYATLCGALYIVYNNKRGVVGEYMLCALFKSHLVLASPIKLNGARKYRIAASIALANVKMHSTDTEFGLQSFTTQHAWKMLFEVDSVIFEILVVASSSYEYSEWTDMIRRNASQDISEHQISIMSLSASPLGEVLGKPGSLLRSLAMKNVTVATKQVIIRNTALDGLGDPPLTMRERLSRPILTPRRVDRARIEDDVEKAGCREIVRDIPVQRSKTLRSSASTLLRKLSRSSKPQNEQITILR